MTAPYGAPVRRWEERTEWPLAGVAVLFLATYTWYVLDAHLGHPWRGFCVGVDYAAWVVFALDYLIRLALANRRARYFIRHLPDLAVVALPFLRPLRLLRLLLLLRGFNRRATASLRGRIAIYVGGAAVLLVFCASLAVLEAERNAAGSNIKTFGDALWWSTATVCTVGYGDRFPVTGEGRAVATGLMLGGIALLGVITASVASWLIEQVREVEEDAQAVTRRDLRELLTRLDEVNRRLDALSVDDPSRLGLPGPPTGQSVAGYPQT
jgi:voltage-gated potassium channel